MKPVAISDVELAFPAHVVGKLLPEWDSIPVEFRERRSPWCRIVDAIFAGEGSDVAISVRKGIDPTLAGRHLRACMASFEPKHEHKIAGVAYLLSLWFEFAEESGDGPSTHYSAS
ncbi:MAG: hypothetical protein Q6370_014380 [Candidatus Sigynarchaeota archaeon]|jgi:hypothetical protein